MILRSLAGTKKFQSTPLAALKLFAPLLRSSNILQNLSVLQNSFFWLAEENFKALKSCFELHYAPPSFGELNYTPFWKDVSPNSRCLLWNYLLSFYFKAALRSLSSNFKAVLWDSLWARTSKQYFEIPWARTSKQCFEIPWARTSKQCFENVDSLRSNFKAERFSELELQNSALRFPGKNTNRKMIRHLIPNSIFELLSQTSQKNFKACFELRPS